MNKIKVSAVSYINTKPFVYGLQNSSIKNKIELSLDNPSDCATKLALNQADIGLVPVAALSSIKNYYLVSDYCIGANGAVNSVFIFSNKSIETISSLQLDPQSRTSNAMARILLEKWWKIKVDYTLKPGCDAFVQIGDRTFETRTEYKFVYDLAEEWKKLTGLPFVFAVWAANKPLSQDFISEFNAALRYGLENISELISILPEIKNIDLYAYLTKNIDYNFTTDKKAALSLFLSYI